MKQFDSLRKNQRSFEKNVTAALEKIQQEDNAEAPIEEVGNRLVNDESLLGISIPAADTLGLAEAIILEQMRPPYLVINDEIQIDGDFDRIDLIKDRKTELEAVTKNVGRIDLLNHDNYRFVGTGWLIEEDIVVTNRHVAREFTEKNWLGQYVMQKNSANDDIESRINYVRQHDSDGLPTSRATILEVLFIAESTGPDIAFLRVDVLGNKTPLELSTTRPDEDTPIAAIGYPAWDGSRNDSDVMERIFKGIYDVKRFSPGLVMGYQNQSTILLSDYTSLGGNSGSAVIDLASGKAVGLHFAGAYKERNYAVSADIVAAALAQLNTSLTVPVNEIELDDELESEQELLSNREGYDPHFLGQQLAAIPLPDISSHLDDIAPVTDNINDVLNYLHFSTIQSKSRRLPLLTAVNINGEQAFRLKRKGTWRLDGRIAKEHQIGNELYRHNPLDRGHLVRRMDPGWGTSKEEAQQAEIDTFHYTNSVPQHKDLNQKDWVGLEDYILESSHTLGFKATVFTGPIFNDDDRTLKSQEGAEDIKIPEEFWKVVVMVNSETNALSATGYILSHGRMIRDLVEAAFVLGEYKTYQVKICKIEELTQLDFGNLRNCDPLGDSIAAEAPFSEQMHIINTASDLRL